MSRHLLVPLPPRVSNTPPSVYVADELSFVFGSGESFGAWKECALRDEVHAEYLSALADCGIKEEDVYGGARVHDVLE